MHAWVQPREKSVKRLKRTVCDGEISQRWYQSTAKLLFYLLDLKLRISTGVIIGSKVHHFKNLLEQQNWINSKEMRKKNLLAWTISQTELFCALLISEMTISAIFQCIFYKQWMTAVQKEGEKNLSCNLLPSITICPLLIPVVTVLTSPWTLLVLLHLWLHNSFWFET